MTEIERGLHTTEPRDSFTVFLLGVRVNALLRPRLWWWIGRMFREMETQLLAEPERGLLHARTLVGARGVTSVQYWTSTEALMRFASEGTHARAWREFHRRRDGAAGIWHETYEIGVPQTPESRGYETLYADIPRTGLGRALGTRLVNRETRHAADRLARPPRSRKVSG